VNKAIELYIARLHLEAGWHHLVLLTVLIASEPVYSSTFLSKAPSKRKPVLFIFSPLT
jgi:hypothetical protein